MHTHAQTQMYAHTRTRMSFSPFGERRVMFGNSLVEDIERHLEMFNGNQLFHLGMISPADGTT